MFNDYRVDLNRWNIKSVSLLHEEHIPLMVTGSAVYNRK
jgi:hypothetical protein